MSKEMDKFRAARLQLITHSVFFGCIAMSLSLEEAPAMKFAAGVDGKHLYINPEMTERFTFGETIAVVAHEVLHVVLMHHLRKGHRDSTKWNVACDYAVNWVLQEQLKSFNSSLKCRLPEGVLLDTKYADMPAEQIYNLLPDEGDSGNSGFDVVMDSTEGLSESEVGIEEAKVRAAVQNAAQLARKAGQMGAGLEKLVEAICEPKANWRSVIRDYITERAETDFNWARPSQRMLSQFGVIFPTLDGEKVGNIVLIADASGSCYNDQEQFCAEVSDILSAYECSLDVIFYDTKVTAEDHYESDDLPIVMRPAGFGGTNCKSAYERAIELNPSLMIHLTDLELSWENVPVPSCDVIIACSNKRYFKNCPEFGRLIDIT